MKKGLLGAIALVTGTTVGVAMIALPISTAPFGFLGTSGLFLAMWLLMCWTGLLFCEVTLSLPKGSHLIAMSSHYLGPVAKWVTWGLYLCLLYALMAAYLSSLAEMLAHAMRWDLTHASCMVVMVFAFILLISTHMLEWINRIFLLAMLIFFAGLMIGGLPTTHVPSMSIHWHHLWSALTIVLTAFGFHIVIPSIRDLYPCDAKSILPTSVCIGSMIPLLMYILWQWMVLGTLNGEQLRLIADAGEVITGLSHYWPASGHGFSMLLNLLMLLAVLTSFIGVSLSLFDFLKDGLCIKGSKGGGLALLGTFLPPLFFVIYDPHGFLVALEYAGDLVLCLLVILPVSLVYRMRQLGVQTSYQAPFHPTLCGMAGVLVVGMLLMWQGG